MSKDSEEARIEEKLYHFELRDDINRACTKVEEQKKKVEEQKKKEAAAKQGATRVAKTKAFWDAQLADFPQKLADVNGNMEAAVAVVLEDLKGERKSESQVWEHLRRRGLLKKSKIASG